MAEHALLIANSASMIDHFNKDNIRILQDMGFHITVAANFKDGNSSSKERIESFKSELKAQGIEYIDLPIPRSVTQIGKTIKSISILRKYIHSNPCRIVHTQTPFGGVVGRLAARKARKQGKCKVIYFVHGFHFFHGAGIKNYIIYYNIEKILARYTDCLITLNNEDYLAAKNKFHHRNVRYVPGVGVDTDAIATLPVNKTTVRKRFGIPQDKHIVLSVAELIPRKNVEGCIRAFAGANRTDTVLVICGKGILMDSLKQLCTNLGIRDRVIFAGYRTDVLDLYRTADLFLFTSFQEGLPVAIMQAMAAELPIIASDIRGNRDLLGKDSCSPCADYLIPVSDIDSFTKKMNEVLDNPTLAKTLGTENRNMCKKQFDIRIVHDEMTKIYQELNVEKENIYV